ncbi:hypothetical protein Y59_11780 [Enterobacter hormaechei]|nr:hypothetical protein Y59_11780 [Enterobacter hormaechei]
MDGYSVSSLAFMYCYNITKYYLSFAAKTTPVTHSLFLKG